MNLSLDIIKLITDTLEAFGFNQVGVYLLDSRDINFPVNEPYGLYIKAFNRYGVEVGCNPWFSEENIHAAVGMAIVSMVREADLETDR